MAWTAPRTWVTGEIVTAALMNTHVRDNLLALEARADVSQAVVTGTRDIVGTVYQNTAQSIMIVTVSFTSGGANDNVTAYTDAATPPTTIVAKQDEGTAGDEACLTFVVLPNNYYKVGSSGSETLYKWVEWLVNSGL